ncbi:MAG: hypothetical protein DRJ42_03740 [Deltaproteobacteria bacterium]|nr:MAG: hypothetical protein DRJ42_03740 [Deltaproteobacteria bacterium]
MFKVLLIGVAMVLLMTAIHAVFMLGALAFIPAHAGAKPMSQGRRVRAAAATVLWMVGASFVEMGAWAALFMQLGAFEQLEPSLYFSSVTYTSLGYGDIVLESPLRILGSVEALTGVIMAGWSTALVITVLQRSAARAEASTEDANDK